MVISMARLAAAGGALAAVPLTAMAGLLIDAGPVSTNQTFNTGNYVAGSEFTITAPMTIRSLGFLDAEGDGLALSHQVGLWSVSTQALLASGTVTPTSATVPSAHGIAKWFMVGVPDVLLAAGVYRVAGEVNGDLIALANDKIPGPGVTITAGYVRTDFPNGGFAYPNLTFGSEAVRATVSDQPVPAPGSLLALAGGVLALGVRRRRA